MDILPQLLVNALIAGSIYALASAGLSLSYGLLRILNFSHGHLMMVGAYMFYWLSVDLSQGFITSVILSMAIMALISIISIRIFVFPFLKYSFILVFVTTLALSTILESAIAMLFGVNVKSLTVGADIVAYSFWGIYITPIQIIIIASAFIVLGILAFLVHLTPLGRRMRALSEFSQAAESLGVNYKLITYSVFVAATILAAYAGVLVGYETNMQPTMGNSYTIKAFAAMILGGLGNVWGTIIGSYILGLIENLSIGLDFWGYSLPAGYKDAFAFIIILLVLLFKPQGLFNTASRRA
jgi:branched-chain amino acid transport system permease protein